MENRERELLSLLARRCGILDEYFDIWGNRCLAEPETQRELLRAMGVSVGSPEDLERELQVREDSAGRLCSPIVVLSEEEPQTIDFSSGAPGEPWKATLKVGDHVQELRRVDCRGTSEGRELCRFEAVEPLPRGIHDAEASLAAPALSASARIRIAVTPNRGHEPGALADGGKLWGVNLPLYGIRSARNWGIGDFEDLRQAVEWAAGLGADLVSLLPLHALFNALPYSVSPYYPSSRLFLNPIYIAVDQVPESSGPQGRSILDDADFRGEIERARQAGLVEYDAVWALKRRALEPCHRAFVSEHLGQAGQPSSRGKTFQNWREAQGEPLIRYATFCALRDHLATGSGPVAWPDWPPRYRKPDTDAVADFQRAHPSEVQFYEYLQWLAEDQLARASDAADRLGMSVGLYLDLAVGVDPCGADAWVYQDVLALGASAGAPPDPFSLLGQRWGLPPAIPERDRETGYSFFLETLRRNSRRAGGLRIDHVLALWRLFWVPGDMPASKGAYVVSYPDEFLGLLRLVSREEECLIVGEDLGTIPPEVRQGLMDSGFFSYRLLIFEKEDGVYRPASRYPRQALVSVTTHDLPTIDGFWLGRDLQVKTDLGQYPDPESRAKDQEGRRGDRTRLLEVLRAEGLLPWGVEPGPDVPAEKLDDLAESVHAFLARTPSALMLVNLDDLLGEREMQNLPGTLDEHPNWRRKCAVGLEKWGETARANRIARAIRREGRGRRTS